MQFCYTLEMAITSVDNCHHLNNVACMKLVLDYTLLVVAHVV